MSKRIEDRKRFGEYVRSIRHAKGISIKELSIRLGYDTRGMISGLESGNAPLPVEQIHRLGRALDLPVDEILSKLSELEPDLYEKYMTLESDITEDFRRKVLGRSGSGREAAEVARHHLPFPGEAWLKVDRSIYYQNLKPMVQLTLDLRAVARFSHDTSQKVLVFSHAGSLRTEGLRLVRSRKNGKLSLAA